MRKIPSFRSPAASVFTAVLACAQPVAADNAALVAANNGFACDLYGRLRMQPGNVFLSPYSLSSALAMTYGGARGNTAAQMAKVLHFDPQGEQLHATFAGYQGGLNAIQQKGEITLATANSLWPQRGYEFLPEFTKLCQTHYQAAPSPVDFANHTEEARTTINRWVEEKTHGKIQDLFKPGVLEPSTRLVLANAVYFKGDWAAKFDPKETRNEAFQLAGGTTIQVPLMQAQPQVAYRETPDLQVIDLPYAGGELVMTVVLPRKVDGLGALEAQLTAENLHAWTKEMRQQKVRVWLPKFTMTAEYSLGPTLTRMGMGDAFSPSRADFSGMNGKRDLCLGAVVHKTFVEVNEQGTEAAAATGVGIGLTSLAPTEPVTFRADHPFLLAIRERTSGGLLFLGRVANPAEQEGTKSAKARPEPEVCE